MTQKQTYQELRRRVRLAHFRYFTLSFYYFAMRTLFYAILIASAAAIVMKMLPWDLTPYIAFTVTMIFALFLPAAAFFAWKRRGSLRSTAVLADRHLHLKEKISSALELGDLQNIPAQEKEWNRLVLCDALRSVERINLQKAFPVVHPRELRWIWIPALVFITTFFILPQWDYLTGGKQALANAADREQVQKDMQKLLQRQLILERSAKEKEAKVAAEISKQIKDLAADLSKGKIDKRDALSQLSSLEQEWEKKKKQLEEMQQSMDEPISQGMKPKMTNELVEALEEEDLNKAAEALSKLEKQLKLGNIDQEGKEQLSKELQKMASSMNMDSPLSKALKNAGNMLQAGELGESLQSMQLAEMSLADMQDLLEQMALIQAALKDLKDVKLALTGEFADGKSFGLGECLCGAGCKGGQCQGLEGVRPWQPGESRLQSSGMGGPGIGRGANAPNEKTDVQMTPDQLKAMLDNAPIQAILPVDGASIKGQAAIGVNDSADFEYSQQAEQALAKEKVPLPLRHQVRLYFDVGSDGAAEE
ncbi:MAG: hypothetical protein JXR73_13310 [Candidatus Omnitrophica bacterium]|nr:hypothetical protein [Candidatus Omnitrophota bacterium]